LISNFWQVISKLIQKGRSHEMKTCRKIQLQGFRTTDLISLFATFRSTQVFHTLLLMIGGTETVNDPKTPCHEQRWIELGMPHEESHCST
jgi:hypothetical protein